MVMAPYAPILTTVPRSLATMAGRVLMVSIHLPATVPRATPEPIETPVTVLMTVTTMEHALHRATEIFANAKKPIPY